MSDHLRHAEHRPVSATSSRLPRSTVPSVVEQAAAVIEAGERVMMKAALRLWLVVAVTVCTAVPADSQPRAGALAIDER